MAAYITRPVDRAAIAPGRVDLLALSKKYRLMAALRVRRDAGDKSASRATLRELAKQFPGSLRELDLLGVKEFERRAADTRSAAKRAGATEPWMQWIFTYHTLLGAALAFKMRRARGKSRARLTDAEALRLLPGIAGTTGLPLTRAFVRAVDRPPGGRLGALILDAVAQICHTPVSALSQTLFPPRG